MVRCQRIYLSVNRSGGKQLAVVVRKMREVAELGLEQTLPTSRVSCSVVSNSLKPHGL